MSVSLLERLRDVRTEMQILDLAVQILQDTVRSQRRGMMNPANYLLPADASAQPGSPDFYPELRFSGAPVSYGEDWETLRTAPDSPVTEQEDVFSFGALLFAMRSGEVLTHEDIALAFLDAVNLTADDTGSFLPGRIAAALDTVSPQERSSLIWRLIAQTTELNAEKRPGFSALLGLICAEHPSSAVLHITDRDTLDELERREILCTAAVTRLHIEQEYKFRNRVFVPAVQDEFLEIPYRPVRQEITLTVKAPDLVQKPLPHTDRLCIGIDFGTWNTSVSYIDRKGIAAELRWNGAGCLRSMIAFRTPDTPVFGAEAAEIARQAPGAAAECFKRDMADRQPRSLTALSGESVTLGSADAVRLFLQYLLGACREELHAEPEHSTVVLTVPACYDEGVRTAMEQAAAASGFKIEMLTEPEAAAFYFGAASDFPCIGKVLVIDIGGGTADISLLECTPAASPNARPVMRTLAKRGVEKLGGADCTEIVFRELLAELRTKHGTDLFSPELSGLTSAQYSADIAVLRSAAESVKLQLSQDDSAERTVPLTLPGKADPVPVALRVRRAAYFTKLKTSLVKSLRTAVKAVVSCDAATRLGRIDRVILTGGASAVPTVQSAMRELFDGLQIPMQCISLPTAVSRGAAVYANSLAASENAPHQALQNVLYDIGVVMRGALDSRARFLPLIRAGEPFHGINISASTELSALTKEEIAHGCCRLYLYIRPPERRDVEFLHDVEGDVIRPIGAFRIRTLPDYFDARRGRIKFLIELTPQECIHARAAFYMPAHDGQLVLCDMLTPVEFDVTDRGTQPF